MDFLEDYKVVGKIWAWYPTVRYLRGFIHDRHLPSPVRQFFLFFFGLDVSHTYLVNVPFLPNDPCVYIQ